MKKLLVFCACIVQLLVNSSAKGELFNLTLSKHPDIFSGFIDVTYNSDTNTFSTSGYTFTFYDGNDPQIDFNEYGDFNISAAIDETGFASSGSLTLTGEVLGYGTENPLLTGNLTDFGFAFFDTLTPNVDVAIFEFIFSVSGGDLADLYGGLGQPIGVILSCVSFSSGAVTEEQFTEDFDNLYDGIPGSGSAVSDTGVPCIVDFFDLANFCTYWLEDGSGIAGDLDDSNNVDLVDYGVFAGYWYQYCPGGWPLE